MGQMNFCVHDMSPASNEDCEADRMPVNQRPEFRSRDLSGPIRGQYSGHMTCLDQSEANLSPIFSDLRLIAIEKKRRNVAQ